MSDDTVEFDTIDVVLDQIAEARAGYIDWNEISMADVLRALEDEAIELEGDEFDSLTEAHDEFTIGRDRYTIDFTDHCVAGYKCGDWSYLTFRWSPKDKVMWVSESHPY